MISDGLLNLGIVFTDYHDVAGVDHFFWRTNHQGGDVRYCLFDVGFVRANESCQSNFFVVDHHFMSFTYQRLNQGDDGTFTKIVGTSFKTESQYAHAALSCLAD